LSAPCSGAFAPFDLGVKAYQVGSKIKTMQVIPALLTRLQSRFAAQLGIEFKGRKGIFPKNPAATGILLWPGIAAQNYYLFIQLNYIII
jgi:hypothetical protein